MAIPKIIIQTNKSEEIDERLRDTWQFHHSHYEYLFFDDNACLGLIDEHYPDLSDTYRKLPLGAQKADLFRYISIYHYGGIYADTDTWCLVPIEDYLDMDSTNLNVGVEMTPQSYAHGIPKHVREYFYPVQYLQWVFAAPPKNPLLWTMVSIIKNNVDHFSSKLLKSYSKEMQFTLGLTGPYLFSQVIQHSIVTEGEAATTILPQLCWGYNHWHQPEINPVNDERVKVLHMYGGTWKP